MAIIEAIGEQEQIKELLSELKELGIKELVRTGRIAMA
jgi:acetolactate synthase small subunit